MKSGRCERRKCARKDMGGKACRSVCMKGKRGMCSGDVVKGCSRWEEDERGKLKGRNNIG